MANTQTQWHTQGSGESRKQEKGVRAKNLSLHRLPVQYIKLGKIHSQPEEGSLILDLRELL